MLIQRSDPSPAVTLLTLNRPEAANALNTALAQELTAALTGLADPCRAVIITGAGKHFCAGADLKEREGMDEAAWETQHSALRAARDAVLYSPVPVIAAVNGAAMGGGLELALAADFIYAAEDAKFALTETKLGIMPGLGGVQLLARAAGEKRAREMLLTGAPVDAQKALEWGIINRLFPRDSLVNEALATAETIAANAPLSLKAIRASLREIMTPALSTDLALELALYRPLLASQDRQEGIAAFNQKRKPVFTGE